MTARYLTDARLAALRDRLGERDRAILARVAELRFVSGGQLARLHFAGAPARTVREALLRLTRLGVLERLPRPVGGVRAGSGSFIYRLGPAGQRLTGQTWRPHVPGTLFMAHALQVAELCALLVEAERAGRLELIEVRAEPGCWRHYPGGTLKPDSFVRLGIGDFEDSFFLEVDMGSEGSRALLAKLRQYAAYRAAGVEQAEHGVFPKVLWATPDGARAEVIRGCVERLPANDRELFAAVPFGDALGYLSGEADSQRFAKAG